MPSRIDADIDFVRDHPRTFLELSFRAGQRIVPIRCLGRLSSVSLPERVDLNLTIV